jgi:hypothetical protein
LKPTHELVFGIAMAVSLLSCRSHAHATGTSDAADGQGHVDGGALAAKVPVEPVVIADDALPPFTSDDLTTRAKHLLEAIQKDDSELAGDIVFPRDAYLKVKDVADPGKHWDTNVLGAFRKHVHLLHHHTKGIERAVFTSFELGQPTTEAMPKKKDLKRMLWRSKRSRLGFTIDGKPSHFDVLEMTSWRGAWYVTKLR